MGIRLLNTFLNVNTVKGKDPCRHFSMLRNKTLCVDISIYLYKFKQLVQISGVTGDFEENPQETLLKTIKLMITIFRKYGCELIPVFDGKPPKEKDNTIEERRQSRQNAQSKKQVYQQMLMQRKDTLSENDILELKEKIKIEVQKSISITKSDIDAVKELLGEMRVKYIQAEEEADAECVRMVRKNTAWGLISDDTDFIVYGCKRIMRNINLEKETCEFLEPPIIIEWLGVTIDDFKTICVLGGCDYFKLEKKFNIFKVYDLYLKYKKNNSKSFLEWMTKYASFEISEVQKIVDMYA